MIDGLFYAPKSSGLSVPQFPLETLGEALQTALDLKLNLELPLSLVKSDAVFQKDREQFKGLLALHAGLSELNPVSTDEALAEFSSMRYVDAIRLAKKLQARYLIFHSQDHPRYQIQQSYKNWLGRMTTFLEELISRHVEGSPLTLLIENYCDQTPDTIQNMLHRINSPHLKASLDIGQANLFSPLSAMDWLDQLGHTVAYLQLHNNSGKADEHAGMDNGSMDMPSFLNHLALLNHKAHVGLAMEDLQDAKQAFAAIQPFLKIQEEQFSSKSFLV